MKNFLDDDFLLENDTAKSLFFDYAKKMPIFDFHNHLSAKEIYENKSLGNLANAWLDHDHYKWRAMRADGIEENLITGHLNSDGSVKQNLSADYDYKRFLAFVDTLQNAVGNPLYHWSHLELQRYFGIKQHLTAENSLEIWKKANELLSKKEFFPRGLLEMQNVKVLCTTDDPIDNLEYHKKLAQEWKNVKVLPSFRPDGVINAESKDFSSYILKLQQITDKKIENISDMFDSLCERIDYFKSCGAVVSDHSLESDFYVPAEYDEANSVFKKALNCEKLSNEEIAKYKGYVLTELGKIYAKKHIVMQIHIGALRDNNYGMLKKVGKNAGEDSLADFNFAFQLSAVLNKIYSESEQNGVEPKVILYNLNPKDNEMLATMAANFRNCIFGPAWWFNDHKAGIQEQLKVYARTSVLGKFVGMLTDSRSFLSFPRHEYFRRILCNFIGNLAENGEYPCDLQLLGKMVTDISYNNANTFFI